MVAQQVEYDGPTRCVQVQGIQRVHEEHGDGFHRSYDVAFCFSYVQPLHDALLMVECVAPAQGTKTKE